MDRKSFCIVVTAPGSCFEACSTPLASSRDYFPTPMQGVLFTVVYDIGGEMTDNRLVLKCCDIFEHLRNNTVSDGVLRLNRISDRR